MANSTGSEYSRGRAIRSRVVSVICRSATGELFSGRPSSRGHPSSETRSSPYVCDVGAASPVRIDLDLVQNASGANGSRVVDPCGFTTAEGWDFLMRSTLSASPGLWKAYKSVRSMRDPGGKQKSLPGIRCDMDHSVLCPPIGQESVVIALPLPSPPASSSTTRPSRTLQPHHVWEMNFKASFASTVPGLNNFETGAAHLGLCLPIWQTLRCSAPWIFASSVRWTGRNEQKPSPACFSEYFSLGLRMLPMSSAFAEISRQRMVNSIMRAPNRSSGSTQALSFE